MKLLETIKRKLTRSSFITVQYCGFRAYDSKGNGYYIRIPDSFKIYVEGFTRVDTHFSSIGFDEAAKIVEFLKENLNSKFVELTIGSNRSKLIIPKWAIKRIVSDIEKSLKEYRNLEDLFNETKIEDSGLKLEPLIKR